MNRLELIERAKKIPNMGAADIADHLVEFAYECPGNTAIVECGVWMGCGTALLSAGAGCHNKIFAYDHFKSNSSEVEKLKKYGISIKPDMDTLPIVKKNLRGYPNNYKLIKSDLLNFTWDKSPIGLYVDDVSKRNPYWNHVCKTFLPHVIEGGILVLMDFNFYKKTGRHSHKTQYMFMNRHKGFFKKIFEKDCIAIFKVSAKYTYRRDWL
jgi:hypothetical protein